MILTLDDEKIFFERRLDDIMTEIRRIEDKHEVESQRVDLTSERMEYAK